MKIKDLKKEIVETAHKFLFIQTIHLIDETDSAVKFRPVIDTSTFIQIYHNISTETINYVLIHSFQRIYGRDCCDGKGHRHPFENPATHDFSAQGSRHITLYEFMKEIENYLIEKELIRTNHRIQMEKFSNNYKLNLDLLCHVKL